MTPRTLPPWPTTAPGRVRHCFDVVRLRLHHVQRRGQLPSWRLIPQPAACSAVGSSMEEAMREVQDAITAWIGAAKEAGNPVPTPLILARAEQALT